MSKKASPKKIKQFVDSLPAAGGDDLINAGGLEGSIPDLLSRTEIREWLSRLPYDALKKVKYVPGKEGNTMPLLMRIVFHFVKFTKRFLPLFSRARAVSFL